jgi:signal transduction histidine kinase
MFKGGPIYTRIAAQVLRFAELLFPLPLLIYGVLIQQNIIKTGYSVNYVGFYILMAIWFIIGLLQFLVPTKTKKVMTLRNVALHLMIGAYLLFVTGISSPISAVWVIMTLSAYVLLEAKGTIMSLSIFSLFVLIDIFFVHSGNQVYLLNNLATLVAIIACGIVTASIFQTQKVSQEKINSSIAKEALEHDRILTLVNNLTMPILSVDIKGVIRVYNAASLNILDTNDSLNGRHIDEVLSLTDEKGTEVSLFKQLKDLKTVIKRDDLEYSFDNNDRMRLEITCAPIRNIYQKTKNDEENNGYIVIFRDVTKEKSLEEERDEFISVTSHELRTPITIAEGTISNVQVMLDHPNITKKMLTDAVNVAHDQILFLAHMVNDLSTLSRAERGISDGQEDIDVRELANMLHDKYKTDAKDKKLHLDLDLSPKLGSVHVSRLYLEELLQNFITNALKYTKKGSVTINFTQKNDVINFAIKDTGIGLSKSDQTKVFDKFYRSEDYRTRETSGTGLGLYIAAKLAHKLNTKIELTSRLNFGSTFSFSLPAISEKADKPS